MTTEQPTRFLAALLTLLLVACGGGSGGGGGGNDNDTGGIDRGGGTVSQGPISGFGSVIVNSVRYSTSAATITIDGQPGVESDLRVGQVVRIEGTLDASGTTGTARSITFGDDVEGPIQAIDLATVTLVVVGQTVQVGPATSFDDRISPRSLEGLAVGDRVEVSGLVGADGAISATRIERKVAATEVEVKGAVSAVDTAARRFHINALLVDYSTAQLSDFANGQPANGDVVEAKGALDGAGVLVATRIERESPSLGGTSDDSAELEGLITRFVSATDFSVSGQRVTTTSTTVYEGGTAANLAVDQKVEVEGRFDASGRVVARKVEFKRESDTEFEGNVDSIDVAASRLVVLGVTVRTNASTRFEDHSDAEVERFGLADLHVGDYIEVRAYRDANGLVATLIERDDAESEVEVHGTATSVAPPNFMVAGVAITTDAQTEFRDDHGNPITAVAFFAAAAGREVKVRGTLVGNTVLAERAELED
jgi:hypothetical protein